MTRSRCSTLLRAAAYMTFVVVAACSTPGQGKPVPTSTSVPEVEVLRDISYTVVDGERLLLDVYRPDAEGDLPALMLIHGGGWRAESKEVWATDAVRIAQSGYVAFAVNYRLAPPAGTSHAPAPILDVRAAASWIRDNAQTYGADPRRLGALGPSAGGHLSLMLATTGRPGADKVDAAVSWSGPTDLLTLDRQPARQIILNFVGCPPSECAATWTEASPAQQVDATDSPVFLANSTDEQIPLPQAGLMAERLESSGVPVSIRIYPGTAHGIALRPLVWNDSFAFLDRHLGEASPSENAFPPWAVPVGSVVLTGLLATIAVSRGRRRRLAQSAGG